MLTNWAGGELVACKAKNSDSVPQHDNYFCLLGELTEVECSCDNGRRNDTITAPRRGVATVYESWTKNNSATDNSSLMMSTAQVIDQSWRLVRTLEVKNHPSIGLGGGLRDSSSRRIIDLENARWVIHSRIIINWSGWLVGVHAGQLRPTRSVTRNEPTTTNNTKHK